MFAIVNGINRQWRRDFFGAPLFQQLDGGVFVTVHGGIDYHWLYKVFDAFGGDLEAGAAFLISNIANGQLLATLSFTFNTWPGPQLISQTFEFRCLSGAGYGGPFPMPASNLGAGSVTWSPGPFVAGGTLVTPDLASLANELIGAAHYPSGGGPLGASVPIIMLPTGPYSTQVLFPPPNQIQKRNEIGTPSVTMNATFV